MNFHLPFDPALSGRLCLTLIHSVWQVGLLVVLAWGIDRLWARRSTERRGDQTTPTLGSMLLPKSL